MDTIIRLMDFCSEDTIVRAAALLASNQFREFQKAVSNLTTEEEVLKVITEMEKTAEAE